jgi:hypothetical protein
MRKLIILLLFLLPSCVQLSEETFVPTNEPNIDEIIDSIPKCMNYMYGYDTTITIYYFR